MTQEDQELVEALQWTVRIRFEMQIRIEGDFVRLINPGHAGEISRHGFVVQSFGVPGNDGRQRRVNKNLIEQKASCMVAAPCLSAIGFIRGNQRHQSDYSSIIHQGCDLSHAPDIF
jgi:hypothetical protein